MTRNTEEGAIGSTPTPFAESVDSAVAGARIQGRYRIVGGLGTGAFGPVCLAEDEATGHQVAIRLLPRGVGVAGAPAAAQPFQRPGRSVVTASTAHPGLVRVLQLGEDGRGRSFVVMEVVQGRRLSAMGRPIPLRDALRLALDLGGPVEALHRLGLVHGALCPRNVMVLEDGRVKVMDVELAGLRNTRMPEGVIARASQEEYLSPEQIRGAPVSPKADVYAFAVILYELLSGAPPFQALTREAVLAKHVMEKPLPIRRWERDVPVLVERLIMEALEKNPEQRPRMQDVLDRLRTQALGLSTRWKRAALVVCGAALAGLVAVSATVGPLPLRPSAPRPAPTAEAMRTRLAVGPIAPTPTMRPSAARPIPLLTPPPPSLPPRTERREPSPAALGPAGAKVERPAAPAAGEAKDPGAVIDWLLKRAATRVD